MRFSYRFGTAIHTLLIIHECSKIQKVTSEFISQRIGVIPVTVRKLLGDLKKAGIVNIAPRKEKEGTTIARPLEHITLLDILMVAEPNHTQEITEPCTKHAHMSYSGIYINEIICGYADTAIKAVYDTFSKITLADTLATLLEKETQCPHENPRALLSKPDIQNTERNQ